MFEKPADLLAHAQERAPGATGSERETRTSWVITDEDAPLGEWWVTKCCGRVFDHSAKLGGHRCAPGVPAWQRKLRDVEQKRARDTAVSARRATAALPWYRRLW